MALNRPRRPSSNSGSFDDPNDRHYDLGLLKVTLHPVGDLANESAIRLRIDSERDSLLEPIHTSLGREPSAADKLIQLVKEGMGESGMVIIEDGQSGPSQPRPPGMPAHRVSLAVREFFPYKPGSDGILIRAGQGTYRGALDSRAMMKEAGKALEQIAQDVRDIRRVETFEMHVGEAYDAIDKYNKDLRNALRFAALPEAQETAPSTAPSAGRGAVSGTMEAQLAEAVDRRIPKALIAENERQALIGKIVKGVLCAGEACWVRQGVDRGGADDPLPGHVREALQEATAGKPVSPAVMHFLVGETSDAIYDFKDRQAGRTGP